MWLDEDGREAVPHQGLCHEHRQLVFFLSQQLQSQVGRLPYPAEREQPGEKRVSAATRFTSLPLLSNTHTKIQQHPMSTFTSLMQIIIFK